MLRLPNGPFAKPIGKKKRRVAGMSGNPVDSSASITRLAQTPGPANPKTFSTNHNSAHGIYHVTTY